MRTLPKLILLPFLALLILSQSGCVGYQLGSMLPGDIESVYMDTVNNQTQEPLLENEVTNAILSAIQRDGSLAIETESLADSILTVTLTDFRLESVSFAATNRARPDEYRLILECRVELVRKSDGQVIVRRDRVQGREIFPLVGDVTSGQRVGLPGASADLARHVVAVLTESWTD